MVREEEVRMKGKSFVGVTTIKMRNRQFCDSTTEAR